MKFSLSSKSSKYSTSLCFNNTEFEVTKNTNAATNKGVRWSVIDSAIVGFIFVKRTDQSSTSKSVVRFANNQQEGSQWHTKHQRTPQWTAAVHL
jgi:hypothetical protein